MEAQHNQHQQLQHPKVQSRKSQDSSSSRFLTMQQSDHFNQLASVTEKERDDQGLKWTDQMARLLITAVSYITDAALLELNSGKKFLLLPKTRKWGIVSTVLGERGYNISPLECYIKFTDMNTKYKQLVGILGRPTSCDVVENPRLLESMDMPEVEIEEVRKILSSKQLLYREMCSFVNNNNLFLPHDPELQESVKSIVAGNCCQELEGREGNTKEKLVKRRKLSKEDEDLRDQYLCLAEEKMEMQEKRLQLAKEKYEWLRSDYREELKLQRTRVEIESLKLKNACLDFELQRRKRGIDDANNQV